MVRTEYYKDLTAMNTFRMNVSAKCFVEYDSIADLVEIEFSELARPLLHIGGGSNLLFTDDFKGTVLHSAIKFIEILPESQAAMPGCGAGKSSAAGQGGFDGNSQEVLVSVGAGVVFDDFCAWAAKEGLWGVENLSDIPGEVGASAVQNIGAYGVEAKDVIRTVYCYDIEEEEFVHFDVSECRYGYRDSMFKSPDVKGRYIVTHVVFALKRTPSPRLDYGNLRFAVLGDTVTSSAQAGGHDEKTLTVAQIRKAVIGIRKEKLPSPSVMGSAGSFFKNPVITQEQYLEIQSAVRSEHGDDYKVPHYAVQDPSGENPGEEMVKIPAAWLIEQCGWKGRRSGGAAVYDRQPLVIVNYTGQAYPEEITGLEKRIISSVCDKFGIELHPEVEHI
ncbi:MAG: UDP-N-acetylmuramate dehydrogenase [Bacteroides sp.]|nr:UDP-N-acetylmuramate dehydrogenase [Bacteroides sp.]